MSVETDFPGGCTFFILSVKIIPYEKSGVYWEPSDMLNILLNEYNNIILGGAYEFSTTRQN